MLSQGRKKDLLALEFIVPIPASTPAGEGEGAYHQQHGVFILLLGEGVKAGSETSIPTNTSYFCTIPNLNLLDILLPSIHPILIVVEDEEDHH